MNAWFLANALIAAFGVLLCLHIRRKKLEPKPLVCPLGADCDTVVRSEFSTFAGVPLEVAGGAYYALVFLAYAALAIWHPAESGMAEARFALTAIGVTAFLFSCYLTFVQAFYIRSWCSWCLTSAAASTLMLLLTVGSNYAVGVTFVPLLEAWREGITAAHLAGFAIGIGGATVADLLFFRFMRDFYISESERRVLHALNQVLWVGLAVVVVSAIGLYLPFRAGDAVPFFWPEVAVLAVVAANGAFLNLIVMPKLCAAAGNHKILRVAEVAGLRRVAFACGSVSFVSWYAAFLTVVLAETASLRPAGFFLAYISALVLGLLASQLLERRHHAVPVPI
ncbi:MAG TPA: vitamin K epoxide reductase family protein [Candidatus Paceibacterota bacterium]